MIRKSFFVSGLLLCAHLCAAYPSEILFYGEAYAFQKFNFYEYAVYRSPSGNILEMQKEDNPAAATLEDTKWEAENNCKGALGRGCVVERCSGTTKSHISVWPQVGFLAKASPQGTVFLHLKDAGLTLSYKEALCFTSFF